MGTPVVPLAPQSGAVIPPLGVVPCHLDVCVTAGNISSVHPELGLEKWDLYSRGWLQQMKTRAACSKVCQRGRTPGRIQLMCARGGGGKGGRSTKSHEDLAWAFPEPPSPRSTTAHRSNPNRPWKSSGPCIVSIAAQERSCPNRTSGSVSQNPETHRGRTRPRAPIMLRVYMPCSIPGPSIGPRHGPVGPRGPVARGRRHDRATTQRRKPQVAQVRHKLHICMTTRKVLI